jgi:CBS domain containing-hemolysin-like protein
VCRPSVFIPVDFSQEHILQALRRARAHIGIVRDRANVRTLGIVTLEDVLESLLGDVREGTLAGARLRGA